MNTPQWTVFSLLLAMLLMLDAAAAAQGSMGSKSTGRRTPQPRGAAEDSARKPASASNPVRKQSVKARVAKRPATRQTTVAASAAPVTPAVVLHQEDFSGDQALPTGASNNGSCTFAYVEGAYVIDANGSDASQRPCHQALPSSLDADVRIEADVSTAPGSPPGTVGLGFGKAGGEFYFFTMDPAGRFALKRCASECGFVDPLTDPAAGTVLRGNGATNTLAVEIRGPVLTMFANGKRLGQHEYEIERDAAGQAVMLVDRGGKAAFHALRVLALPN